MGGRRWRAALACVERRALVSLALPCWLPSPPSSPSTLAMQLLQHANDDTLRALQRRLQTVLQPVSAPPHRTRPLARTQSVPSVRSPPGRILFNEDSAASHGSTHSSSGSASRLQRTSSGSGLPGGATPASAGGGGLRRTSSLGVPPPAPVRERPGGSCPRPAPNSLHRLSGSALRRTSSTGAADLTTPSKLAGAAGMPQGAEAPGSSSSAAGGGSVGGMGSYHTPEGPLLPFSAAYEDTAAVLGAPCGSKVAPRVAGAAPGSPLSPVLDLSAALPSWESSGELSSPPGGSPFGAPASASASYASPASQASPGSAGGGAAASAQPSPSLSAASSLGLSRQPTFSQPYFAEFEEDEPSPAAAALLAAATGGSAGSAGQRTPPGTAPAAAPSSASARAAALAAAADQMTAEELHQVGAGLAAGCWTGDCWALSWPAGAERPPPAGGGSSVPLQSSEDVALCYPISPPRHPTPPSDAHLLPPTGQRLIQPRVRPSLGGARTPRGAGGAPPVRGRHPDQHLRIPRGARLRRGRRGRRRRSPPPAPSARGGRGG